MIDPTQSLRSLLVCMLLIVPGWCGAAAPGTTRAMLVMGDSLSAGYGIGLAASWPALLDQRLRTQGYPYHVVNASISGETTAGGARRLQALLDEHDPAIVVIALGANDGLRAIDVGEVRGNLERMITAAREAGAVPVLVKVRVPPNYGPQYTAAFEEVYDRLGDDDAMVYAPFMLERFATSRSAFQSDGLHPTAAVQPRILDTLWPALEQAMTAAAARVPPA
jgi:acyl-CoA thioesterase-1